VPIAEVADVIRRLVHGSAAWTEIAAAYPAVEKAAAAEEQ
jgi:hypothetical protein